MDDLKAKLQKISDDLDFITKLLDKYGDTKSISENIIYKRIEDGILENLQNAEIYQLENLKKNFRFRYYDKNMVDELIDNQMLRTKRKNKINKIINNG